MSQKIPYTKHIIDDEDLAAVRDALVRETLTGGNTISEFEKAIAEFCGARFCVVCANGTAALHMANLALAYPVGSKVIAPAVTFAATVNSILYVDGIPVLCDINPETVQISPANIEEILRKNENVKGIIPVHMGGHIGDCEKIGEIAKKKNLFVIEDACHSYGGQWRDSQGILRTVGDCSYSDMTVLSFHPAKLMCTGEGGAVTTNDPVLYERLIAIRSHGIERNKDKLVGGDGGWYYEVQSLGYNYRMTEFQAALGLSQLKKVPGWIKRRIEIVKRYDQAFAHINEISPQHHPKDIDYAYHLYIVKAAARKELYESLRAKGIFAQVHYIPIHYHPYFQKRLGVSRGDFPQSESYYEKALSLPLYSDLSDAEQQFVIEAVYEFYGGK